MNTPALDRLEYEVKRVHQGSYFVSALSKLVDTIGNQDPCLCNEAINGYVLGGLVAGLDIVGVEMMGRCEELENLIQELRSSAPHNADLANRGADEEGDQ